MNTALIAFGSALLGAFAGGLAAALGSDWAQKRQLRRAARIHMFETLLFELSQVQYTADYSVKGPKTRSGAISVDVCSRDGGFRVKGWLARRER